MRVARPNLRRIRFSPRPLTPDQGGAVLVSSAPRFGRRAQHFELAREHRRSWAAADGRDTA